MSIWGIAWRSIQQRWLSSLLTALSMALGVALVTAMLSTYALVNESFKRNASPGYDLLVGAKGGSLQLVLNSVFYLSQPVGNIPYSLLHELKEGKASSLVEQAVPICLGDRYKDYRVVGTTPDMFDLLGYGDDQKYQFSAGKNFAQADYFGAVIGSQVANSTGLKIGDEFNPTHGAGEDGHKHDAFHVVGILAPTGTPQDRALFINIEGFFLIPDHRKPAERAVIGGATPEKPTVSEEKEHDRAAKPAGPESTEHDHDHAEENKPKDPAAEHDHSAHDHAEHAEHDHAEEIKAKEPVGEHEHADHDHAHDDHTHDDHAHDDDDHPKSKLAGAEPDAHADHDHADHDHAAHDEHAHGDHDHAEHDHAHEHQPVPESEREVTAILVRSAGIAAPLQLKPAINRGVAQAVSPSGEIYNLFELVVKPINFLLVTLAGLIVLVSGISVMVGIYNSMQERRREIAVMRALGAGRSTVMLVILVESLLLAAGGGILGWLLGHGLMAAVSPRVLAETGVSVGFTYLSWPELYIIPALTGLAVLVGLLPAISAYRTDVAKSLQANP